MKDKIDAGHPVSLYNYFRTRYSKEDVVGRKEDHYYHQFLVDGKVPTFETWCREKYGKPKMCAFTMYQFLGEFGYLNAGNNSVPPPPRSASIM